MIQEGLWLKLKKGDKKAFGSVYELCIDDMYAYGLKLNANKELVKDCIQEVFIDIFEHRNSISEPNNIKFYILKSLKHTIFRKLKKERRNVDIMEFSNLEFKPEYNIEDKRILGEINDCKIKLIKKALQSLSSKQREILYLRFTMGLTYHEISEIVKIDHNSVRKQVYRAIKKLRNSKAFDDYQSIILFYSSLTY
ncbi:RNA polymerase sigma factor [Spongiimicrobium sp. 3-5]|uniref:RNA polymerase sigma factor n=1 Tax=Spongiimicrobium sp. 3-5 TaxID=3332596 RepID=UPI0039814905